MITDKITSLYRADILKCKADTLVCQRVVLETAMRYPDESESRSSLLKSAMELGEVATEYDFMIEPSQKQRDYWKVMKPFYERTSI